jgi:hypothetical protein
VPTRRNLGGIDFFQLSRNLNQSSPVPGLERQVEKASSLRCADTGADCPGAFTTEIEAELMNHAKGPRVLPCRGCGQPRGMQQRSPRPNPTPTITVSGVPAGLLH